MDKVSQHIGKIFQEYRIKNGMTQNEIAEKAGMEPRYVSQIERGISKGSIDTLLKLCNAYKITPDIVLYDLLDNSVRKDVQIFDEKYKKLSIRDKNTINELINLFLKDAN
ncbi:MAG: helix-turn-helix transcriptional regulator [Bacilli bacterium]|nr:helix-turn-helix transcriptional regulator [Bacilli bacterium]